MIYVITDTIITYLGYNISMRNFEKNIRDDVSSPWDILKGVTFSKSSEGCSIDSERSSKKPLDVFVRRVFELNPESKSATFNMLKAYGAQNKKLPFLHITPNIVEYESGECVSTGNVDSIKSSGFLPGDSNVGGFVAAGEHYNSVGNAESFKTPEAFLKSYIVLLRHYLHHASRLNHRNSKVVEGKKIKDVRPAFVLVRGDLRVDHGTDYEDHFILRNGSSPEDIIGTINIDDKINLNDPNSIAQSYDSVTNSIMMALES